MTAVNIDLFSSLQDSKRIQSASTAEAAIHELVKTRTNSSVLLTKQQT